MFSQTTLLCAELLCYCHWISEFEWRTGHRLSWNLVKVTFLTNNWKSVVSTQNALKVWTQLEILCAIVGTWIVVLTTMQHIYSHRKYIWICTWHLYVPRTKLYVQIKGWKQHLHVKLHKTWKTSRNQPHVKISLYLNASFQKTIVIVCIFCGQNDEQNVELYWLLLCTRVYTCT